MFQNYQDAINFCTFNKILNENALGTLLSIQITGGPFNT